MAQQQQQRTTSAAAGPVVLITGCSAGGIGNALAHALHARGARVFGTLRRPDAAPDLAAAGIQVVPCDVTDPASCASAVAAVVAAAGRLDVVVNNAGIVTLGPACEVPEDAVRGAFDTNVFGLLAMCRAAHRQMAAQGGGKIVNIGSLTGLTPVPLRGIYSATKGAVLRLTDAMRIELAPLGVDVLYVAPGFIASNIRANAGSSVAAPLEGGLWGRWYDALTEAIAPRLANAVALDTFAGALAGVILRDRLPRIWVGPCAGLEWLPRFLPNWLRDRMLAKSLGITALGPQIRAAAAALAAGSGGGGASAGGSSGGAAAAGAASGKKAQ